MNSEELAKMYEDLDPGIREVVRTLRDAGFCTTDSGDGSKASWMEGALEFPHVACMTSRTHMFSEADYALKLMPGWAVEATYSPNDGVCTLLMMDHRPETAKAISDAREHAKRMAFAQDCNEWDGNVHGGGPNG